MKSFIIKYIRIILKGAFEGTMSAIGLLMVMFAVLALLFTYLIINDHIINTDRIILLVLGYASIIYFISVFVILKLINKNRRMK